MPDAPAPDREQRLEEILRRSEAATPGPWPRADCVVLQALERILRRRGAERLDADMDFIAHAREDVLWLLAELARVEQERGAMQRRAEAAEADWQAIEQERDRLRELALAVVDTEGCCTGKILDAMDRLRAALEPTP